MLIPELGESVICRHEQIISADMMVFVERRPMAVHSKRQHIPLLLNQAIQRAPGLQRTKMHRLGLHLGECAGEFRIRTLLPIADTIAVIEGDIADRRPAIRETNIGFIPWHISFFLKRCPV
jgi:hypothetical protein